MVKMTVHQRSLTQMGGASTSVSRRSVVGDAVETTLTHHTLDALVVDLVTVPEAQFGGLAPGAVYTKSLLVDVCHRIRRLGLGVHPPGWILLFMPPLEKTDLDNFNVRRHGSTNTSAHRATKLATVFRVAVTPCGLDHHSPQDFNFPHPLLAAQSRKFGSPNVDRG